MQIVVKEHKSQESVYMVHKQTKNVNAVHVVGGCLMFFEYAAAAAARI